MPKKIIKKIAKKVAKKVSKKAGKVITEDMKTEAKYNEYGVCLACNGGNPNCIHNNLVQVGRSTVCAMCGFCVKCG